MGGILRSESFSGANWAESARESTELAVKGACGGNNTSSVAWCLGVNLAGKK